MRDVLKYDKAVVCCLFINTQACVDDSEVNRNKEGKTMGPTRKK